MAIFLLRRIFQLILTLLGGFTIMFLLFFALPDDPAAVLAGGSTRAVNPQVVENTRVRYGFDKPLYEQYFIRLRDTVLLRGTSFKGDEPVRDTLAERLPNSLRLAFWALAIESVFGIGAGVISARKRNSISDWTTTLAAVLLSAVPVFVLGYLLKQVTGVYAYQHDVGWLRFPTLGVGPDEWYLWIIPTLEQLKYLIQPGPTTCAPLSPRGCGRARSCAGTRCATR